MKPTTPTRSRLAVSCALATLFSTSLPLASAATLNWDSGGTSPATGANGSSPAAPSSTAGTWSLAHANWSNGSTNAIWVNANNDTANFAGSANYQVTLAAGAAISAGGLNSSMTANAVTLAGGTGATLTLAGSAPKISGAGSMTLSIALQGSNGLTKEGAGTLRFNTAATYTGDTVLSNTGGNNGQITLGINNALPTTTKLTSSATTNFTMQGYSQTLSGLAGAGTVRTTSGSTSKLTLNGSSTDTYTGSINDGATVGVSLAFERGGTGTTHLNGASAYRGATTVSGGVLSLGSNLSGTGSVLVSGGTLTSTVASVTLGTGAFSLTSGALTPNGASIGTFNLAAGQNFTASVGTLNFTLGASNTSDLISGSGAFNLSNLTLALDGATSVAGTYTLFSGFTGNSISGLTISGLGGGYTGSLGTDGVLTVTAIPEPSALAALIGATTLGFAALRRRKARA